MAEVTDQTSVLALHHCDKVPGACGFVGFSPQFIGSIAFVPSEAGMSQQEPVQKRLFTLSLQKGKEKGQGPTIPLWNMHSNFLPGGLTGPTASHLCPRLGSAFNILGLGGGGTQALTAAASLLTYTQGGPAWLSSQNVAQRSPSADHQQFGKVPHLRQEPGGFPGHDGVTKEERSAPIPRQESGSILKEPKGSKAQKISLRTYHTHPGGEEKEFLHIF